MSKSGKAAGEQHGITITYAGAESLLDSAPFAQLLNALTSHLPLRNLHWKPSAAWSGQSQGAGPASPLSPQGAGSSGQQGGLRTIQTLGTRLEPLSDTLMRTKLKPETRHLIQRSLLDRPFCHLYFVISDDSDSYRTHVRNDIRAWLGTIQGSPTLSAATVTARAFQGFDQGSGSNGASTPRAQTPPVGRPDTPTRTSSSDEPLPPAATTKEKEKSLPPSPEYLIVVVTPPEGSALAPPTATTPGRASPGPANSAISTPTSEVPRTGLQRFYSSGSSTSASAGISSKANSVVEKIKADFNTSRKERVVHLTRLPNLSASNDVDHAAAMRRSHADPTIFAELILRVKESVISTFDAVVGMQDEAVRKELQKRDVPGWNYNKWMAGMECLAHTFDLAGLYTDALAHYEEVDTVFMQCLLDGKLPYFTHVGASTPGDDSAVLLDVEKKDYRDLILRNEISLFDFRCYLFAKRAHLLGKIGRIAQVMSETPIFLSKVATMLQDESLVDHFLESWTFSSAIDVVEQCQAWLIERGDVSAPGMEDEDLSQSAIRRMADRIADSQLSASFHAAKAELLDLARRQLDKIGMKAGHLPNAMPFSLSRPLRHRQQRERHLPSLPNEVDKVLEGKEGKAVAMEKAQKQRSKITRQELIEALESREVFDLRYVALSERILAGWISSGRRRNVLRLRCVLASVDYFRKRYTSASSVFASMTEPYAEGRWRGIEAVQLARRLDSHKQLGRDLNKDWIDLVVALLKARSEWKYCRDLNNDDPANAWLDEDKLFSALQTESVKLDDEIPISRFSLFYVKVSTQNARLTTQTTDDGPAEGTFTICATIDCHSTLPIVVDDVRFCITSGEHGDLWFTSGPMSLQPGRNNVHAACASGILPGRYVVDVSQVRIGKVIFQSAHRQATSASLEDQNRMPVFITIPEDGDALDTALEWAPHVFLDRSRTGVLTISTGRNTIERLEVGVALTSGEKRLRGLRETVFKPSKKNARQASMDVKDDKIVLAGLSAQTEYLLLIPFHEVNGIADGILHVRLDLQSWSSTVTGAAALRLRRDVKLSLGLPLGVNVQDFFRHDKLLSKFVISAGAAGPLCLTKVDLWSDLPPSETPYVIDTPWQEARSVISLAEPASFVFAIRKNDERGQLAKQKSPLRLTLVYRMAHEEALDVLLRSLDSVCRDDATITSGLRRCLVKALSCASMTDVDLDAYANTSQLRFRPLDRRQWLSKVRQWCGVENEEDEERIVGSIQDVFAKAQVMAFEASLKKQTPSQEDAEYEIAELQEGRRPWRKLSLPVEVPTMTMVNAVTVRLADEKSDVRVGVSVDAIVEIQTSFAWSQIGEDDSEARSKTQPQRNDGALDDDDDFEDAQSDLSQARADDEIGDGSRDVLFASVDVNCDFVTWLLSGVKRTIIQLSVPKARGANETTTQTTQTNRVKVSLLPLQSGLLTLPTVSIWPLTEAIATETPASHAHRKATTNGEVETGKGTEASVSLAHVSSDTFITNEASRIRVLPRHSGPSREQFWVPIS